MGFQRGVPCRNCLAGESCVSAIVVPRVPARGEPCDVCFSVVVTAHDDTALPGCFPDPFPQSLLTPTLGNSDSTCDQGVPSRLLVANCCIIALSSSCAQLGFSQYSGMTSPRGVGVIIVGLVVNARVGVVSIIIASCLVNVTSLSI